MAGVVIRRNNEKRGMVTRETVNDRLEIAARLRGIEEQVALLKPILTRWFSPRPLKRSLMQFLRAFRFRNGSDCVDRLALRHLDVLIGEFIKWCPDQCSQLLPGHLWMAISNRNEPLEPAAERLIDEDVGVFQGEGWDADWVLGEF
jgi:hypothetical protein